MTGTYSGEDDAGAEGEAGGALPGRRESGSEVDVLCQGWVEGHGRAGEGGRADGGSGVTVAAQVL